MDINNDGIIDFKGRYKGRASDRSAEDPLAGAKASSRCDGEFDVTISYSENGVPEHLTFNADRDGITERYEYLEGFSRMAKVCSSWKRWIPYDRPSSALETGTEGI